MKGIIFASYNYRLSLWGFPHAQEISDEGRTQNLGLLDTRAAVEWLYANVEKFGGDRTKITLGGTGYSDISSINRLISTIVQANLWEQVIGFVTFRAAFAHSLWSTQR